MRRRAPLLASLALLTLACKSEQPTFASGGTKVAKRTATKPADKTQSADIAKTNAPAGAVTKGSFTAWAIPSHPQPGQNYQIFIEVPSPVGTAVGFVNAPEAETYGGEFQITAIPYENFTTDVGISIMHSQYDQLSDINPQNPAGGAVNRGDGALSSRASSA